MNNTQIELTLNKLNKISDSIEKLKNKISSKSISPNAIQKFIEQHQQLNVEIDSVCDNPLIDLYEVIMNYVNNPIYDKQIMSSINLDELIRYKNIEDVIIYINEFKLYILFKFSALHQLSSFLRSSIFKGNEPSDRRITIYAFQVLFYEEPQKIYLLYNDVFDIKLQETLKNIISKCFKATIEIFYIQEIKCYQLMINSFIDSGDEQNNLFKELNDYLINNKINTIQFSKISGLPLIYNLKTRLQLPYIYLGHRCGDQDYMMQFLGTKYSSNEITYNNTINVSNINDIHNQWIKNNNPEHEIVDDYYEKYVKYMKKNKLTFLYKNVFNSLVRNANFLNIRETTNGIRNYRWRINS